MPHFNELYLLQSVIHKILWNNSSVLFYVNKINYIKNNKIKTKHHVIVDYTN